MRYFLVSNKIGHGCICIYLLIIGNTFHHRVMKDFWYTKKYFRIFFLVIYHSGIDMAPYLLSVLCKHPMRGCPPPVVSNCIRPLDNRRIQSHTLYLEFS